MPAMTSWVDQALRASGNWLWINVLHSFLKSEYHGKKVRMSKTTEIAMYYSRTFLKAGEDFRVVYGSWAPEILSVKISCYDSSIMSKGISISY